MYARFLGLWLLVGVVALSTTLQAEVLADKVAAEKEREEMRVRLLNLQKNIRAAEKKQTELEQALKASDLKVSEMSKRIQKATGALQQTEKKLQQIHNEKVSIEAQSKQQQEKLAAMARQQYQSGNSSAWQILLSDSDRKRAQQNAQYLRYVAQQQAQQAAAVEQSLKRLKIVQERQQAEQAERKAQATELENLRMELVKEQQEQKKLLQAVHAELEKNRSEARNAEQNSKQLTQLIERLEKVLNRPQQEVHIAPPVVTIPESAQQTSVKWRQLQGKPFKQLKGKLMLPATGKIADLFGREKTDGGAWEGVLIQAKEGSSVQAIADGTVVYSDWYAGFGNLLIIDHGAGYLSVYGYNQSLLRSVGDSVKAGDKIAQVGRSGGQKLAALYFEIRFNGKPIHPLEWVKA